MRSNKPLHRLSEAARTARFLVQHAFMRRKYPPKDNLCHLRAAVDWLNTAQDGTPDDGVSKGFALNRGWLPSYVETTGYIIPTMFDCSIHLGWTECRVRALKMGEWELSKQLANGAFPGCQIATGEKPLVFDTGMVLFGLIRSYQETGDERFKVTARKGGDWLIDVQHSSGAWNGYTLHNRARAYHTRVAWALLELFGITHDDMYRKAAVKNLQWAVKQQHTNGWYENNVFYDEDKAITHTIAYATRGLLESGIITQESTFIDCARKTARSLCDLQRDDGSLPGSFNRHWMATPSFSCLSGNAQVGIIWLRLFQLTRDIRFLEAAHRLIHFLKGTQDITTGHQEIRGGMKSTHPIYRGYMKFFYSSWAVKFFIDLLLLDMEIAKTRPSSGGTDRLR